MEEDVEGREEKKNRAGGEGKKRREGGGCANTSSKWGVGIWIESGTFGLRQLMSLCTGIKGQ